jgi:hypothetical protein
VYRIAEDNLMRCGAMLVTEGHTVVLTRANCN